MFSFSRVKARPALVALNVAMGMFVMLITQAVIQPLSYQIWPRDNNGPILSPEHDYTLNWMSDATFREREKRPQSSYVTSPDGLWHLQVLARGPMNEFGFQSYLKAAVPTVICSIYGLLFCLYGLRADSSCKMKEPDRTLD